MIATRTIDKHVATLTWFLHPYFYRHITRWRIDSNIEQKKEAFDRQHATEAWRSRRHNDLNSCIKHISLTRVKCTICSEERITSSKLSQAQFLRPSPSSVTLDFQFQHSFSLSSFFPLFRSRSQFIISSSLPRRGTYGTIFEAFDSLSSVAAPSSSQFLSKTKYTPPKLSPRRKGKSSDIIENRQLNFIKLVSSQLWKIDGLLCSSHALIDPQLAPVIAIYQKFSYLRHFLYF